MTNSELKLPKSMKECDTEMYFSKLYNLERLNLKSNAKFARDFCEAGPNKNRDFRKTMFLNCIFFRPKSAFNFWCNFQNIGSSYKPQIRSKMISNIHFTLTKINFSTKIFC